MTGVVAYLHEPATAPLVTAAVLVAGAAAIMLAGSRALGPPRIVATGESSELGDETPAVASLLTSGFVVTPHAAVATLLDLVARGWLRIEPVDDEVVVLVDGHRTLDDPLTPYEQQVLNHVHRLASGTASGVTGTGIEVAGLRLSRGWIRRFNAAVVQHARQAGLCRRRWPMVALVVPAALLVLAGWQWWRSLREGAPTAIADSLVPRAIGIAVAIAILVAARPIVTHALSQAQRPTDLGRQRAGFWMSVRAWMEPRGFALASSTAARNASRAVGYAAALGLAERASDEVPVLPEEDEMAWSNASGHWHIVRVRYPFRPGYGRHPLVVLIGGLVVGTAIVLLQRLLLDIGKGHTLAGVVDDFEEQADLIHDVAVGLAAALMLPLLWTVWLVVAGAFDLFATIERRGPVVRARRPQRVVPHRWLLGSLARRDRYALFVAVDDGRSDRVTSWLANERTAVPQGARAHVRATPLLGYVRSSEPIGTR